MIQAVPKVISDSLEIRSGEKRVSELMTEPIGEEVRQPANRAHQLLLL